MRLDPSGQQLQGVWYNAHRNIEGRWCAAADVPRAGNAPGAGCASVGGGDGDGPIVGYVAIRGHGIYPRVRRGG